MDTGLNLHATAALGKGYEQATIAYKFYDSESLPTDEDFTKDVTDLLIAYEKATTSSRTVRVEREDATGSRVWVYAPGDRAAFWNEFYDSRGDGYRLERIG